MMNHIAPYSRSLGDSDSSQIGGFLKSAYLKGPYQKGSEYLRIELGSLAICRSHVSTVASTIFFIPTLSVRCRCRVHAFETRVETLNPDSKQAAKVKQCCRQN